MREKPMSVTSRAELPQTHAREMCKQEGVTVSLKSWLLIQYPTLFPFHFHFFLIAKEKLIAAPV
jgi:hypothetical protein